jgi:hypothetical protein
MIFYLNTAEKKQPTTNMMSYNNYYVVTLGEVMEKLCSKCKQLLDIALFSTDKYQKSGRRTACKLCSAVEFKKFKASGGYTNRLKKADENRKTQKKLDPLKYWAHNAFHNAKGRAKKLCVGFDLTKEWLITNAPTHCPLLGIELTYSAETSVPNCASIDRVDSLKGYTLDNCKIISFKANRIKSNATLEEIEILTRNLRSY